MENWGLLTYRETALLVNEADDDIQQVFYIALVVSHEVGPCSRVTRRWPAPAPAPVPARPQLPLLPAHLLHARICRLRTSGLAI